MGNCWWFFFCIVFYFCVCRFSSIWLRIVEVFYGCGLLRIVIII